MESTCRLAIRHPIWFQFQMESIQELRRTSIFTEEMSHAEREDHTMILHHIGKAFELFETDPIEFIDMFHDSSFDVHISRIKDAFFQDHPIEYVIGLETVISLAHRYCFRSNRSL